MQKQRFDPAWVSGLPGSPGNVLPVAEIYKGLSCSKAAYARSCCFSATGSYVLSHFPLDNPSLHKTCNQLSGYSEGTQRLGSIAVTSAHWGRALERGTVWKRKTLPYFSVPDRHEVSVWRERGRKEGPEAGEEVVLWGFDASRGYHIRSFWGSLKSLLYKTLTRLSSSFWYKGWTYKQ